MKIKLVLTCPEAPEQYDAVDERGNVVGYLRLRGGYFYASVPNVEGKVVFESSTKGWSAFEDDEREHFLNKAVAAIKKALTP